MKKVTIHGFYGMGNLGDEVILKTLDRELKKVPDLTDFVFCPQPHNVEADYDIRAEYDHRKDILGYLKTLYEIKTSDLFLLGGGGLLKDYGSDSSNIKKWLRLLRIAQKLRVKTMLFAMGIDRIEFDDSKRMIRETLNKVTRITVRDNISKNILRECGVTNEIFVTDDPALLYMNSAGKQPHSFDSSSPKVIVSVRHWFAKGGYIDNPEMNQNLLSSLGASLDFLIEKYNATILFIPLRTHVNDDDRLVAQKVVSEMKNSDKTVMMNEVPSIDDFINELQKSDLVLGMRLHSLILAVSLGIPCIGFNYMPKVQGFFEQAGLTNFIIDLDTLTTTGICELCTYILSNYNKVSKALISKAENMKKIARLNFDHIFNLIGTKK